MTHLLPRPLRTTVPAVVALAGALSVLPGPAQAVARDEALGTYNQSRGTVSLTGRQYGTTADDVNAVLVSGGTLGLDDSTVTKSGDTTYLDNSRIYGQNAAVLAEYGAAINLTDSEVVTDGTGASGVFVTNDGSALSVTGGRVTTSGSYSNGADANLGATMSLRDVDLSTTGEQSAAAAATLADARLTLTGGTATATGPSSPALASTGTLTASGTTIDSADDYAATVDGANTLTLDQVTAAGAAGGIRAFNSAGGTPRGPATVTVRGGSLDTGGGDAFRVDGTHANLTVQDGAAITADGRLLTVLNGGTATLTAVGEALTGDVLATGGGDATVALTGGTTLSGSATGTALTLDAGSGWNVTADSAVTALSDPGGISGDTIANIIGNGHTVTYDPALSANKDLDGRTYTLRDGGSLRPAS
ncbi:hypothetical protein [Streptomyces sp. NPDC020298]|uniref:hypothetical protein n=1 Tax=unclassified Streptomyces TaxID=2593676 RepID=UPI0033D04E74